MAGEGFDSGRRRPRTLRMTVVWLMVVAGLLSSLPTVASAQGLKMEDCDYGGGIHAPCPSVEEDSAITGYHPHSKTAKWHMSTSVPSGWRASVKEAAKAWTDRTTYTFHYQGTISSTDWTNSSTHIVWHGTIPKEWKGCQPSDRFYGCTRHTLFSSSSLHLKDADTVLNKDHYSFGTSTWSCIFNQYDVQTAMVHEFGHWGHLFHSDAAREITVMNPEYDGCDRTPYGYDQKLMEHNFVEGGHTAS